MSDFIPNSFMIANALVDELLISMTESELKCYLTIVRKTTGWQKLEDQIATSQFMAITGLSNRAVITACQNLQHVGLIKIRKHPKGNIYSLVRSSYEKSSQAAYEKSSQPSYEESSQVACEKSSQEAVEAMKIFPETYEKSSHTKDNIQNTNKENIHTRVKTKIPENFGISPDVRVWAADNGYTHLEAHFESFRDKALAKGYQYIDWDAALRDAIRQNWAGIGSNTHQASSHHSQNQSCVDEAPRLRRGTLFAGLELIKFNELCKLDPTITQINVRDMARAQNIDVYVLLLQLIRQHQTKGQGAA